MKFFISDDRLAAAPLPAEPEEPPGMPLAFSDGLCWAALQASCAWALLQMAWDHVSSALDGRESAFELHASGGIPAWRGRLRRSFERYNELANAVVRRLDPAMPEIHGGAQGPASLRRRVRLVWSQNSPPGSAVGVREIFGDATFCDATDNRRVEPAG